MSHNIFWFRNNLRINDNYPLVQCIKDSTSISFVYIVNRHLRILDGDENHKNKFLIEIDKNKTYSRQKKQIFYARNGAAIYITKRKIIDKKIFNDKSSIDNILSNQMNYSDKNVFNNIQVQFEKILDEKN